MFTKSSRPLVAEFLGTFLLASAVIRGYNPFVVLGILVLLMGSISGGHFNPAVTLGLASVKKFPMEKVLGFWAVQLLGAFTAKFANQIILDQGLELGYTFSSADSSMFAAELIGAAVFVCGIMLAVRHKLEGLTLAVAIGGALMLGAIMGGGLNPAVAISFVDISIASIVGTFIGAVIGAHIGQELGEGTK